jgi:hypothetical protein
MQQAPEPSDPARPDNLFAPPPGDPGARGPFSDRARARSPEFWVSAHRLPIGVLTAMGLAVLGLGWSAAERFQR